MTGSSFPFSRARSPLLARANGLDSLKALSQQEHLADPMELGSFAGTIVWRDEHEPYVHAHMRTRCWRTRKPSLTPAT